MQWIDSVSLRFPEGRHNVAHRGSGGKCFEDDQKTPAGVTQGPQPDENTDCRKN